MSSGQTRANLPAPKGCPTYLDSLDGSIDRLEKAVEEEQVANARLAAAALQMNAAADVYLQALDDQEDFPQIISDDVKDTPH